MVALEQKAECNRKIPVPWHSIDKRAIGIQLMTTPKRISHLTLLSWREPSDWKAPTVLRDACRNTNVEKQIILTGKSHVPAMCYCLG